MFDFDFRKFGSTFQENKLNGFDAMVMESAEAADKVINDMKKIIDKIEYLNYIALQYDTENILDLDQRRIEREVKRYGALKGIEVLINET